MSFFLGQNEAQPSGQWISGQVEVSKPAMKSIALHQLHVLHAARVLIDSEIARIEISVSRSRAASSALGISVMSLPKIYSDENAARKHLEGLLWPEGPFCPHCGNTNPSRIHKLQGKSTRPGVYKCRECEKPFSVTVGTVFERSHVPLHKWIYAVHLLTTSKKGISSHQLMRMLDVTYKTAWFMSHRIREGMRPASMPPMGGGGKAVEVDETFIGRVEGQPKRSHGMGTQKRCSYSCGTRRRSP